MDSNTADQQHERTAPIPLIRRRRQEDCPPAGQVVDVLDLADMAAHRPAIGQLGRVLLATGLLTLGPVTVTFALRLVGVISSPWLAMGVAVILSVGLTHIGGIVWSRYRGAGELLFSELLLWEWLAHRRQERQLAEAVRRLERAGGRAAREVRSHTLRQLASVLEGGDLYLNGHSRRVAKHAAMIARTMGLSAEETSRVHLAAAVHDIGKLQTPSEILNLPRKLTDAEFAIIQRHPVDGARIVEMLGDPELTAMVRHHHERLDGRGYPDRLAGDAIPLGARIIAVADTFDAITSARAYRAASPHAKALAILRREAGAQLDPDAVHAFLSYYAGHRPILVWSSLGWLMRRVGSWLSGSPALGATWSGKLAAVAATVAVGGVAAGTAPLARLAAGAPTPGAPTALPLVHREAASAAVTTTGTIPGAVAARGQTHRPRERTRPVAGARRTGVDRAPADGRTGASESKVAATDLPSATAGTAAGSANGATGTHGGPPATVAQPDRHPTSNPASSGHPVSTPAPSGHPVSTPAPSGHPVSTPAPSGHPDPAPSGTAVSGPQSGVPLGGSTRTTGAHAQPSTASG